MRISTLDTTLRDGAQGCGISFSLRDKEQIIYLLDELGIDIIEAGNPAASPKDAELLSSRFSLTHARLAAFGATRRKDCAPKDDPALAALGACNADIAVIFGKCSLTACREVIRTTPEENLRMISQSVEYLLSCGKEVIFDAEHFFDSFNENPDYALNCLMAAQSAGAAQVCLCDTCGGTLPSKAAEAVAAVTARLQIPVSIHAHDDSGLATAVSLAAVEAGAVGVQGTLTGIGERCGNANLSTVIPDIMFKLGLDCITREQLERLTPTVRAVAEICNTALPGSLPYVGKYAFSHKAGMHVDAIIKQKGAYEHIPPESVGNRRQILLSEYSGRGSVIKKLENYDPALAGDEKLAQHLAAAVKQLEHDGYRFDGADASFELLALRTKGLLKDYFRLELFKVMQEQVSPDAATSASAMVKIAVNGQSEMSAAEGLGPVDALDKAMRRALTVFYPSIAQMRLTDFKVRVLDSSMATASQVRVLVESTDGVSFWSTTGVSTDIIKASTTALVDSMVYKLYRDDKAAGR